jgi:hypothetical protein
MAVPKYRTIYEAPCGDETHRVAITKEGAVVMLDHNPQTVAAFMAFGAAKPACLDLQKALYQADAAYRRAKGSWTGVDWDHEVGFNRLQARGVTEAAARHRLKRARYQHLERIDRAIQRYTDVNKALERLTVGRSKRPGYHPRMGKEQDLWIKRQTRYNEMQYEIYLEQDLIQLVLYVAKAEAAARDVERLGAQAHEAFLDGDIGKAIELAHEGEAIMSKFPRARLDWHNFHHRLRHVGEMLNFWKMESEGG